MKQRSGEHGEQVPPLEVRRSHPSTFPRTQASTTREAGRRHSNLSGPGSRHPLLYALHLTSRVTSPRPPARPPEPRPALTPIRGNRSPGGYHAHPCHSGRFATGPGSGLRWTGILRVPLSEIFRKTRHYTQNGHSLLRNSCRFLKYTMGVDDVGNGP